MKLEIIGWATLSAALFAAWMASLHKRAVLESEVDALKLALDKASIHRDSRGRFVRSAGFTAPKSRI